MENEIEDILEILIDKDLINFKCFDLLKEKLRSDIQFRKTIKSGIKKGFIKKFPRDLFEKICNQNVRIDIEPIQIFAEGYNIGNCTFMSQMIGYSLDGIYMCGGKLPLLNGTKNSPDGRHTWISYLGNIIDSTLMIVISEKFAFELGYLEEKRYEPEGHIYNIAKDYANDTYRKKYVIKKI